MKRNFVFTAISIGSRLLTGLLLFVLLARLWGPADFGLFSFVFSLVAIIVLLVDFGFAGYLLREVGAAPEHLSQLFHDGLFAKSWLLLPCLTVAAIAAWVLDEAAPAMLLLPLLLAALLLSYADFCIAPLRALGRYDIETGVVVSANFAQFLLAGAVAWQGGGPVQVAWVIVLSRLGYLALAWISLRRTAPAVRGGQRSGEGLRSTFRRILPYGVDGLLTTAWSQLDVVLVRVLYGVQAAGIYAAGQKVVQGGVALAPVFGNVFIPRLSRLASIKSRNFEDLAKRSSAIFVIGGLLLSIPLVFFSSEVTALVFGSDYDGLSDILAYLGLVLLAKYMSAAYGVLLTSIGLQKKRIVSQLIGLVVLLCGFFVALLFDLGIVLFMIFYLASVLCVFMANLFMWRRQIHCVKSWSRS